MAPGSPEDLILITTLALMVMLLDLCVRRNAAAAKKKRKVWVRSLWLKRPTCGFYETLIAELSAEHIGEYKNFMRMSPELFNTILDGVAPLITKKDSRFRSPIGADIRLALTLRFLASGETYPSLQFAFRIQRSTICLIIKETCDAIQNIFLKDNIVTPMDKDSWLDVAKAFSNKWQFHHTLGCIDGKHIAIRLPRKGGSRYYNYKHFHSILLLAVVDANYKFMYIDVGAEGSCGDAGVFRDSSFMTAFSDGDLDFPHEEPLPNDDKKQPIPYFLIADDAFALKTWLMKPYSQRDLTPQCRIFNYRLSRARRLVENAFGILVHRFRCLLTTLQVQPSVVQLIVLATCTLHNMLLSQRGANEVINESMRDNSAIGGWQPQSTLVGLRKTRGNTSSVAAKHVRDYLASYYNSSAGSVPWQEKVALGKY